MNALLIRLEQSPQGAIGVLLFDGAIFCFTLQPDEADKAKFHIPAGDYIATRYHGTRVPNTFIITRPGKDNIDGHKYLEFHAGNTEADTEGCVLVGSSTGKLKGNRAVLNSGVTFQQFLAYTANVNSFPIKIIDLYS